MTPQIIESRDGSHTLFVAELNETYHSKLGAIRESQHVFIDNGLKHICKNAIAILEVGMGTGLNVLLTALNRTNEQLISYTALEPFPLTSDLIKALNYCSMLKVDSQLYERIHLCAMNVEQELVPAFFLRKELSRFQAYETQTKFDLIYYDAFAWHAQPDLWQAEMMKKCNRLLNSGGVLVTYCSKSSVQKDLIASGFAIEKLTGPPGKREMLRATKTHNL